MKKIKKKDRIIASTKKYSKKKKDILPCNQ